MESSPNISAYLEAFNGLYISCSTAPIHTCMFNFQGKDVQGQPYISVISGELVGRGGDGEVGDDKTRY